jgi:hypothetical protein
VKDVSAPSAYSAVRVIRRLTAENAESAEVGDRCAVPSRFPPHREIGIRLFGPTGSLPYLRHYHRLCQGPARHQGSVVCRNSRHAPPALPCSPPKKVAMLKLPTRPLPCPTLAPSCPVLRCPALFYPVLPSPTPSCRLLPRPAVSYSGLCRATPDHLMPCPALLVAAHRGNEFIDRV